MCNKSCIEFGRANLGEADVRGKSVIEVGALDVNGSLRDDVEALKPTQYLGVDIEMGPRVDQVCNAYELLDRFGPESFDLLITTELMEHVRDWRKVVSNFKRLLRPLGSILITTRSKGFAYHGYPFDYWRYETSDMQALFSDFQIEALEKDPLSPGVFLKARKPERFLENDLNSYQLYSIIKQARANSITLQDLIDLYRRGYPQTAAQPVPAKFSLRFDLAGEHHTFELEPSPASSWVRLPLPKDLDQVAEIMAAAEIANIEKIAAITGVDTEVIKTAPACSDVASPSANRSSGIPEGARQPANAIKLPIQKDSSSPRISVLMPTFNRPQLLQEAVESVLKQTFTDIELIVVNDGGEDVRIVLEGFHDPRIIYLPLAENQGKAHALNQALARSRAPFVAYLDDDDHYFPAHLETLLREMEAHPEAGLVYSDFEEVNYEKDESGQRRQTKRSLEFSADFNREALFKESYIPHPTVLHRRELLEHAGGFNESFPCLIDWEFLHRLAFYNDFRHIAKLTGEYFINREKGDHITNLYESRRELYMDYFYRIRRQLPPRPWPKVAAAALLVRLRAEDDLTHFIHRLLFVTHYPCEIFLIKTQEQTAIGLPDPAWLRKMNVEVLSPPEGADPLDWAAQKSDSDILVTLDSSFQPYNGWLYPQLQAFLGRGAARPIRLSHQSTPSPWGWVIKREEFLAGVKPWQKSGAPADARAGDCEVSIIIPVRNKVNLTRQCLASIARTKPLIPYEIIVVDNASSDGTEELLGQLERQGKLTWVRNDPPQPFAASCNRGAGYARGKYLLFLNNDTIALPGWLEELYHEGIKTDQVGAVGAKLLYPDETIQHAGVAFHRCRRNSMVGPYHIYTTFNRNHPAVNKVREFQVVTGACLLTPRVVFEELGGFDERYVNCFEDVDYCLHLRSRGYKVIYTPKAELFHLEGQTPGRNDAIHPSRVVLQEKWGDLMLPDDQNYLPDEGFSIEEADTGRIFICVEVEIQQWKESIQQLVALKQWLMALEELDRIVQVIGSHHADLQEMKGHCLLGLGEYERARQAFYQAQKLNPTEAEPKWGLVLAAQGEGKMLEARSRLSRLMADYPGDPRQETWKERLALIRVNERAALQEASCQTGVPAAQL